MLTDSQLIILDEATSALNPESEETVQQGLVTLYAGCTVIVIAHRLSTIRNADHIIGMGDGRVVEEGSFDGLLAQDGFFSHLYAIATSASTRRIKIEEAGFA